MIPPDKFYLNQNGIDFLAPYGKCTEGYVVAFGHALFRGDKVLAVWERVPYTYYEAFVLNPRPLYTNGHIVVEDGLLLDGGTGMVLGRHERLDEHGI